MFSDPILNKLINQYPAPDWTDRSDFLFEDLVESIISQQLSMKAADSIFKRFKNLFATVGANNYSPFPFPTPQQVLAVDQGTIRGIGVSTAKSSYIHNVARAFVNGEVDIKQIKHMSEEEVIATLTTIKGVGKWTAEMILIFTLNRPNVFSHGDLGLRNAIKNLYGITEKEELLQLVETWSPNKSLASWYLWRSLENK